MFKIIIKWVQNVFLEKYQMEILTVKNIAQSCSNLLQKYKGRPEKGKICKKTFAEIFVAKVLIYAVVLKI